MGTVDRRISIRVHVVIETREPPGTWVPSGIIGPLYKAMATRGQRWITTNRWVRAPPHGGGRLKCLNWADPVIEQAPTSQRKSGGRASCGART